MERSAPNGVFFCGEMREYKIYYKTILSGCATQMGNNKFEVDQKVRKIILEALKSELIKNTGFSELFKDQKITIKLRIDNLKRFSDEKNKHKNSLNE